MMVSFLFGTVTLAFFVASVMLMILAGADPRVVVAQAVFFVASVTLILGWEALAPWRRRTKRTWRRWRTNFQMLFAKEAFTAVLMPLGLGAVAVAAAERGIGLFNMIETPLWVQFLVAIVALDFLAWLAHLLLHRVPTLWAIHEVHHTDEELDATSVMRGHPFEAGFRASVALVGVIALGLPAKAVLVAALLRIVFSTFHHGAMRLPGGLERVLRWVIVTPTHHRIHHSAAKSDYDTNFAQIFSIWDRLFGTYLQSPLRGERLMVFGLGLRRPADPDSAWGLVMHPFRRAQEIASRGRGLGGRGIA